MLERLKYIYWVKLYFLQVLLTIGFGNIANLDSVKRGCAVSIAAFAFIVFEVVVHLYVFWAKRENKIMFNC